VRARHPGAGIYLLLCATLFTAATPEGTADRAYWLVGNWHCESRAGSKGSHTFTRVVSDGSINLTNIVRLPSNLYLVMRERYEFDPATNSWSVNSPGNAVWGPFHATADRWLGEEWVFVGKGTLQTGPRLFSDVQMRMVYRVLGENEFHRQHDQKIDQRWQTYSDETCTRDPLPQARPTP